MSDETGSETDVVRVQSVDRAITILEILAREGEAGVTDVAAELGVHKSTAFRLIATMQARGLVEQADDQRKYRIGLSLVRIAGTSAARSDVVQLARPMCKRLAAETGETINLAVLVDSTALYVDQIAGEATLQPHNWVGQRIPLHATSNGKVLLAHLSRDEVDRLVPHLERHAPPHGDAAHHAAPPARRGPQARLRPGRRRARAGAHGAGRADPRRPRRGRRRRQRQRLHAPDGRRHGRGDGRAAAARRARRVAGAGLGGHTHRTTARPTTEGR